MAVWEILLRVLNGPESMSLSGWPWISSAFKELYMCHKKWIVVHLKMPAMKNRDVPLETKPGMEFYIA